ncbi:MAG: hypothetical protein DRR16_07120 [Candidatus Parabeggiatoa sp. nov. 3]|nr:MAG: hypothetical protein DRR00_07045 [Gammaproteobacteria bacterium]RKZ68010.1 MAG: hypothetical protein DRQ99_05070 [Gammaproteobacteria bacterium]RKZ87518.1 MAG: hypothetical protein DRR16_07120 [Gammaproteobacteria bacterium]HEW98280.1 hypothetical protein [Beggiatoa sp.]
MVGFRAVKWHVIARYVYSQNPQLKTRFIRHIQKINYPSWCRVGNGFLLPTILIFASQKISANHAAK